MAIAYSYPLSIPLLIGAASLAVAVAGVHVKRRNERRKKLNLVHWGFWGAAALGVVFTLGIATDRVVLDDEKLEQNGWIGARKTFSLRTLVSVTISNQTHAARRGRMVTDEVWTAAFSDGSSLSYDVGDLWEAHGADIAQKLRARGVEIHDAR